MTLKQKFDSIDQSKLNSDQKDFLGKIEKATKNFTSDNKEVNDKVEGALDKMIATFKEKMPEVIKTKEAKKEPKASAKKATSKPSKTSSPKRTVMSVAKEIRKDGESWADAQKRARAEINKDKASAEKEVKTEMQKLMAFIKTRKELQGISGTDLGRDSVRQAKPRGRRISKDGNVYYENRENRIDRLAPNYPKDAPLLEKGGDVESKDTWQNLLENFGFKKGRSKYGVDIYSKRGYVATVDNKQRNVELMFDDELIYSGYSIQELLNSLESEFGKSKYENGGDVGKKLYYERMNVGKAKYTVNYHDGVKTHRDGSAFYDIAIFKNKKDLQNFISKLSKEGYKERSSFYENGGDFQAGVYAGGGKITKAEVMANMYKPSGDYYFEQSGNDMIIHLTSKDASNSIMSLENKFDVKDNGKGYHGSSYILSRKKYSKGGMLSPRERYNLEIKGMTGVSVGAIEKYIDENDLNDNDVLNIVVGLGRRQLNGADVSTAIVGKKGNAESKRLIRFVKDDKAMKMELGGNVGGYDLAGHLGGNWNVGQNDGALSGVSGTQYSGLVGETGAMSSGEMFEDGGYLTDPNFGQFQNMMFENGGNVGGYNLAGQLGGNFNVGQNNGDLSGVSGTNYSGLVGETGTMSSGELFMNGGGIPQSAQHSYMIVDSFGNPAQHLAYGGDFQAGVYNDGGKIIKPHYYVIALEKRHNLQYGDSRRFATESEAITWGEKQFLKEDVGEVVIDRIRPNSDGKAMIDTVYRINKEYPLGERVVMNPITYEFGGDFQAGVYAEGGSLENHGIKEGDTFIKTISGGIQKVKDKDGNIVFINLATGERDSQPPLPFKDGGKMDTSFINKDGIRVSKMVEPKQKLSEKEWMAKYSESKEARAYGDGGNLESNVKKKLAKNFSLPLEVAVYVPSTKDADENISEKEFEDRIETVQKYLSGLFGGFSSSDVDGGYMSNEKGLITEEVYKVISFAQKDNFSSKMEKLVGKIKEWAKDWGQESIGLEFEGDLFYIDQKGNFEEGGDINAFSMRMVRGSGAKPSEVFTEEKSVKFKKGGSLGKSKNYIVHADIKSVTVNQKGMKYTFKGSDVLNGANILEKGNLLETKAIYVPKREVISVELKDGSEVKPSNGYWIKKDASGELFKPKSENSKINLSNAKTKLGKGVYGNDARTEFENINGYDWQIVTMKRSSGDLVSTAKGGKKEISSDGRYSTFTYDNESPSIRLVSSKPSRVTEKVVEIQHSNALQKFKEKIESESYSGGGKVTFKEKANAIAKNFEGKRVEPKYQKEYGKTYDAKEAKEVGNKIAGAQKAKYDSKAESGTVVKRKAGNPKMKEAMILAKKIRKDGEKWTDAVKRAYAQVK